MNVAFNNRLNPRNGKRERLAVGAGVAQFTMTNFEIAGSADGKLNTRKAEGAVIEVTGSNSLYWTFDGSAPSAAVGFKNDPGDFIYLNSYQQILNFKATRESVDTSIEAVAMFPA